MDAARRAEDHYVQRVEMPADRELAVAVVSEA